MSSERCSVLFARRIFSVFIVGLMFGGACLAPSAAKSKKTSDTPNNTAPAQNSSQPDASFPGNVDRQAPLQGNVDRMAPLQGNLDRPAPLQGSVDRLAPLQGNVDRLAPLQGNVDRMAPLHGNVDRQGPLNGRVQGLGNAPLNSMTPGYQAIMRIVQFKDKNGKAIASPPPITREEIESARTRGRVDLNQIPSRAENEERPPLRIGTETMPAPSKPEFAGRPKRSALATPQREMDRVQSRPDFTANAPPSRDFGDSVQRPVRGLMQVPPPPSRVEVVPERISMPPTGSNLLLPPNQNTLLVNPITRPDLATTPQRAEQNKLRVKQLKKPKQKTIDIDLANKTRTVEADAVAPPVDEDLLWDKWYEHVNALACRALQRTMSKHGNPAGRNRIRVTVYSDHRLEADVLQGTNNQFNQAILEAYRSLNGSSELQFPFGTHRTINSYETAHIQDIPAVTAGFDSTLVHGDRESFVK